MSRNPDKTPPKSSPFTSKKASESPLVTRESKDFTISKFETETETDATENYPHIKVLVRVRPLLKGEKDSETVKSKRFVTVNSQSQEIHLRRGPSAVQKFRFDAVYDETVS